MFGNTLTVFCKPASGSPDADYAVILTRIQESSFSSEYLWKGSAAEFRLRIRHSKQTLGTTKQPVDRHNIELTCFQYPTVARPQGITNTAYMVVLADAHSDGTEAKEIINGLLSLFRDTVDGDANRDKLVGWAS